MTEFSVAVICKNEQQTLPRLLKSLKGVDDIVILDTGSTDRTVEIARRLGCNVIEVGDKFKQEATQSHYDKFKGLFGFEPSFKVGEKYFHFANARNYALSFTKHDWVFQPDADEIVEWDLEKVKQVIGDEDQLVYRFCFAYDSNDVCLLEFAHSKFFRKSKTEWKGWVHEIYSWKDGQVLKPQKYVDFIYLKHRQVAKAERGNYLPGLELAVMEESTNDRNVYYLAREYYYHGQFDTAIKMFDYAIPYMKWSPEIGQAWIFKGNCYERLGNNDEAIKCYHMSLTAFDTRREPWWSLAEIHSRMGQHEKSLIYLNAAVKVPFKVHGYLNSVDLYGWRPWDLMVMEEHKMDRKDLAKKAWIEEICQKDIDKRILKNISYFYSDLPEINIIAPEKLHGVIKKNTEYPHIKFVKKEKGLCIEVDDDVDLSYGWLERAFADYMENKDKKILIKNCF